MQQQSSSIVTNELLGINSLFFWGGVAVVGITTGSIIYSALKSSKGQTLQTHSSLSDVATSEEMEIVRDCVKLLSASLPDSPDLEERFSKFFSKDPIKIVSPFLYNDIANVIDHTLLKAQATELDIQKLCQEAIEHSFAAVCVNGSRAKVAIEYIRERHQTSRVKIAAVVGFPLGAMTPEAKAFEASQLVDEEEIGVDEIDMVLNVGKLKEGNFHAVYDDIFAVVSATKRKRESVVVKVILETCLLTKEEIIVACLICVLAGADFVKTSTGFSTGGATLADVRLMKLVVGNEALVKASGGVGTYNDALEMIKYGAARIGTSRGISIIQGKPSIHNLNDNNY